MTAKVRVREASLDDYEALITLFDELDEFHRQARPDFFRPFDGPARTREQIEQWLIAPNSTVLVAQTGQAVVGLAVLLTRPASGFSGALPRRMVEVDNLVVRADQRGRRIGHQLLDAARDWCRGRHATHLEVAVHAFNRDARRFYEDFGFAPSVDRLVMAA
ncbi:MAG: GNAT family N-acetyltransferase [Reyranellaceae bacterium]